MSTIAVDQITDSSGGNTVTINGATPTQYNTMGRNRIINGDMRIDQRNAGSAVTTSGFVTDRFNVQNVSDGAFSAQQDTSAPTGFINSLKVTVTTADASITTTQNLRCDHRIEGTNVSDLAWGTANAKTVTLSFWVRSSLTGNFGGAINNSAFNRVYPFTYTISAADTWEYKTITIPGDTTGTWLTTTGIGINITWSLGSGPSRVGTANAWAASNLQGVTGQVQLLETLNATWYITGVQLEVGSVATEFERRPYGTELALCQRYYEIIGVAGAGDIVIGGYANNNTLYETFQFKTEKRASPTVTKNGTWSVGGTGAVQPQVYTASKILFRGGMSGVSGPGNVYCVNDTSGSNFTASAEL